MRHSGITQTPNSRALGAIRRAIPNLKQAVANQLSRLKDSGYFVEGTMTGIWLLDELLESYSPAPVLWFNSSLTDDAEFDVREPLHLQTLLLAADCADTGFDSLYLVDNREHLILCRSGTNDPSGGGIIRSFGNGRVNFVVATRGMEHGKFAHDHSDAVWKAVMRYTPPARRDALPLLGVSG